jgi:hypothetical protein
MMKNLQTANNKSIIVDPDIYDALKNKTIREGNFSRFYVVDENKKRISLFNYIFKTGSNERYLFKNNNRYDLRRDNVVVCDCSTAYRHRPPLCGKKYKGITYSKKIECWYCKVSLDNGGVKKLRCDSEYHAAQVYNALLDYLNLQGYRNEVEPIELTDAQKKAALR